MTRRSNTDRQPLAPHFSDGASKLVSRRILILANILRRAATLRYRRLLNLPGGEWAVIAELGALAPRSLGDLSSALGLDKTQSSRTVSSLVDRGLVKRQVNPSDNREVQISLTKDGAKVYAVLLSAGLEANDKLLAGISSPELALLNKQIEELTVRARYILQSEQDRGEFAQTN
jgi:DNA-binding MarR family transcriptional regulator